ncbi:MAG TPA: cytochrome c [Puia sp.]|nr:cytochrome c [Puia sp.]
MKRTSIITIFSVVAVMGSLIACNEVKRKPSKTYMPDMAYSRAYETYSVTQEQADELAKKGIHYSNMPVSGTIARGEELPYHLKNDSAGYAQSAFVKNPLPPLTAGELAEAKRLFNINCAICHGDKLDGNGPLYKGGSGPYAAAPAQFVGNPKYMNMPEGTMYHSATYGKNMMGSYASQLSRKQRWMVIYYIKSKQAEAGGGTAPAADSSATAKK